MNGVYIRIYYNNSYCNYEINKKIVLDVTNCNYYVYLINNKIYSNFVSQIEFNKLQYDDKYNFSYMFYVNGKSKYIKYQVVNLIDIVDIQNNVCIDLNIRKITFDTPIYIENTLYEKGEFFYSSSIIICVDNYEFYIDDNSVKFMQKCKYKKSSTYSFEAETCMKIFSDFNYEYNFNYSDGFKEFSDSISKYVLPPVLMLVMMGIVALVTKRMNMILFMMASSVSTVTGSLVMYFIQKSKVKIHNDFVMQTFNSELYTLTNSINIDAKNNYKQINFKLITQNSLCFGYKLKNVDIQYNINDIKLKKIFLTKQFSKYYLAVTFEEVSVTGQYANLYVYNLLIQILKINPKQMIVFIGKFPQYSFIETYRSYMTISNDIKLKDCIIFCNTNINLDKYLNENIIIYINRKNSKNIIQINSLFKNKIIRINWNYCNKTLYSALESNKKTLFIHERKLVFDSSKNYNTKNKGIRLCNNYTLDIEKDGPHGLIVGMTGSGKSVLLLQIILEIASMYSPKEAVIGIIDFKGDALISKLISLPHISSTFSNLTGGYENVIASIKYEMVFRQKLFSKHNISEFLEKNIGLPKLFIIIDEFAELKKNLNEISNEIDSIARVGRSLGIYLIVSMQKASGVVSEQLKSNLSYSICLKVNSPQDSYEVIGEKTAAFFSNPGEAIVVTNNSTYINVYNCLQMQKKDIVINGNTKSNISVLDFKIRELSLKYKKTNYVIWKSFPNSAKGVLLNITSCKEFIKYDFIFSNYLIIGSSSSGKSELVKNILNSKDYFIVYLGSNKELLHVADIAINDIEHIKIYIKYMTLQVIKCYFIIDNYELYDDEDLNDFALKCSNNKYQHIKLIVTSISVSNQLSRIVKLFNNKFMFSVNDPVELYNIFYKKYSRHHFNLGEGICNYDNNIVEFKSYPCKLSKARNVPKFNNDDIVYLESFDLVDLKNSILIYDILPDYSNLFYSSIYYKDANGIDDKYNIITCTEKFEYKYRKSKLIKGMLYDFTNNEDVIVFNNLNYKNIE